MENEFLCQFADISPVSIQEMNRHRDQTTGIHYQTYEFIKGIPLTAKEASLLTKEELLAIAKKIGAFLSELHSFPLGNAKKMRIGGIVSSAAYGQYFRDVLAVDKPVLLPYLTTEEWQWIEKLLLGFYEHTQVHPFPLTVIHGDLICEHILIDEITHELSGIIDFALQIADPANDFKMFDLYGEEFLRTAYKYYIPRDDLFEMRRKFYTGDRLVAKAYRAILEDREKTEQEKSIQELKKYIATHPHK